MRGWAGSTLIKSVSPAIPNNGLPSDSSTLNTQLMKLSLFCHPSLRPRFTRQPTLRVGETLNEPQCLSSITEILSKTLPHSHKSFHPSWCALARCIGRFPAVATRDPNPNDFSVRLSALGGTQQPVARHTADHKPGGWRCDQVAGRALTLSSTYACSSSVWPCGRRLYTVACAPTPTRCQRGGLRTVGGRLDMLLRPTRKAS